MSRTFSTNSGSAESLKISARCGCRPRAFQMRWMDEGACPTAAPHKLSGGSDMKWFAFRAYNSETQYGYGTTEDADRYSDLLNTGREVDLFSAYELTDEEAAELGLKDREDA